MAHALSNNVRSNKVPSRKLVVILGLLALAFFLVVTSEHEGLCRVGFVARQALRVGVGAANWCAHVISVVFSIAPAFCVSQRVLLDLG